MQKQTNRYLVPLSLVGLFFFLIGISQGLNGPLIPVLREAFQLSNVKSYLVLTANFSPFVIFFYPAAWGVRKIGYRKSISLSFLLFSFGWLLFLPSAAFKSFPFFLLASFVCGTANTLLQTAINPYITILGPIESATKRMCAMTITDRVGWAIAPIFLALFINIIGDEQIQLTQLYTPFWILVAFFFTLSIFVRFSPLPEISAIGENEQTNSNSEQTDSEQSESVRNFAAAKRSVFCFPHLLLGIAALFFYVGVDVLALTSPIDFAKELGWEHPERYTTNTVIAVSLGAIVGIILIPKYLSQLNALRIGTLLAALISVWIVFAPPRIAIYLVSSISFTTAVVWGAVWALAISYLGKYTKIGSALLAGSSVGAAVVPLFFGALKDYFGNIQHAYCLFTPCILYIVFYAFIGYKIGVRQFVKKN